MLTASTTTISTSPSDCPLWTLPENSHIVGYEYDERGCQYPITECNEGFVEVQGSCYSKFNE